MAISKSPAFRLLIVDKSNTKNKTYAGVVFDNDFNLQLKLNPGVTISSEMQEKYWFSLLPYEKFPSEQRRSESDRRQDGGPYANKQESPQTDGGLGDKDDDLPF